jgi:hypothetical protein
VKALGKEMADRVHTFANALRGACLQNGFVAHVAFPWRAL